MLSTHRQLINNNPENPQILDILIQTIKMLSTHRQLINNNPENPENPGYPDSDN